MASYTSTLPSIQPSIQLTNTNPLLVSSLQPPSGSLGASAVKPLDPQNTNNPPSPFKNGLYAIGYGHLFAAATGAILSGATILAIPSAAVIGFNVELLKGLMQRQYPSTLAANSLAGASDSVKYLVGLFPRYCQIAAIAGVAGVVLGLLYPDALSTSSQSKDKPLKDLYPIIKSMLLILQDNPSVKKYAIEYLTSVPNTCNFTTEKCLDVSADLTSLQDHLVRIRNSEKEAATKFLNEENDTELKKLLIIFNSLSTDQQSSFLEDIESLKLTLNNLHGSASNLASVVNKYLTLSNNPTT